MRPSTSRVRPEQLSKMAGRSQWPLHQSFEPRPPQRPPPRYTPFLGVVQHPTDEPPPRQDNVPDNGTVPSVAQEKHRHAAPERNIPFEICKPTTSASNHGHVKSPPRVFRKLGRTSVTPSVSKHVAPIAHPACDSTSRPSCGGQFDIQRFVHVPRSPSVE